LIRSLESARDNDIRICGIFDDRAGGPLAADRSGLSCAWARAAELVESAASPKIDMLIVSLPITAENRSAAGLEELWVLPVDIRLSAHTNKLRFRRAPIPISEPCLLDIFDKPDRRLGFRWSSAVSTFPLPAWPCCCCRQC